MLKKILVIGLVLTFLGYAGAEIWVNNYAESAIARKLEEDHPEAAGVEAQVSIPLLISLLGSGRIRRVGVGAEHVAVAQVPVVGELTDAGRIFASMVDVELSGVQIDRDGLLQRKQLQVSSIEHLDMTVEISQSEVSKVLAGVPGVEFELLENVVRLKVAGAVIGGTFEVRDATRLSFVPGAIGPLPGGLDPVLQLTTLPFARCTERLAVEVEQGKLVIHCSQDNPPVQQ